MRLHKDFQQALKIARAEGWDVHISGGGHVAWVRPDGRKVFTSHSPSSGRRSTRNCLAKLKRAGLDI